MLKEKKRVLVMLVSFILKEVEWNLFKRIIKYVYKNFKL